MRRHPRPTHAAGSCGGWPKSRGPAARSRTRRAESAKSTCPVPAKPRAASYSDRNLGGRVVSLTTRPATVADAVAVAAIYNQGIAEGTATFETRPRSAADVAQWFDGDHPIIVAEADG